MVRRSRDILAQLGEDIDPDTMAGDLTAGYAQMVEIAKALSKNARILVMDEPTASLSEHETEALFALVARLKRERHLDRLHLAPDGRDPQALRPRHGYARRRGRNDRRLRGPIGAEDRRGHARRGQRRRRSPGASAPSRPAQSRSLQVRNLRLQEKIEDASFDIHPGEIVGLAGLMGSGRTAIARALFGRWPALAGEVLLDGKPILSQSDAIDRGVALVPEDRRMLGLVLDHSVRDNIILPNLGRFTRNGFVNDGAALKTVTALIRSMGIKTDGPDKLVRLLSGGNQQKIVIGKWLARNPRLLVLDEPTIGVDIGAKSEIVEAVRAMADKGVAVLVISSELEELMAFSDSILVLYGGRITQDINRREIATEEELHHAIQGHDVHEPGLAAQAPAQ